MKAQERFKRDTQIFSGIKSGKSVTALAKKHHLTSDYVRRLVQEKNRDWSVKRVQPNGGADAGEIAQREAAAAAEKKRREDELKRYETEIDHLKATLTDERAQHKKEVANKDSRLLYGETNFQALQKRVEELKKINEGLFGDCAEMSKTLATAKAEVTRLREAQANRSEQGLTDLNLFAGTLIAALTRWMQKP